MKRIAIFPGSFDPFTVGHASIVERGLPLFDEIVIGVGVNENKGRSTRPKNVWNTSGSFMPTNRA